MKSIKISLIAAMAAGSFGALNATPLEEAIKGVEVGGSFRYRYDSFITKQTPPDYSDAQIHEFKAQLTTGVSLGSGFKAVGTLNYSPDNLADTDPNAGPDGGFGANGGAKTKIPIVLQEAYLRYDSRPEFGTAITLGRQRLNTIWTDNDNLQGSAGMKAQLINTALPGATLTAFAVDSVDDDGDFVGAELTPQGSTNTGFTNLKDAIFAQNLYGAAAIFDYSEQVGVTGQVWFGYVNDRIAMYAVDLGYSLPLGELGKWSLQGQYLGNSPVSYLKSDEFKGAFGEFSGGNLYTIATGIEVVGLDFSVGYTAYGKKDKFTLNVLEDMGDIITAGEEIQNLGGSSLHGDIGQNQIIFATLGYTLFDKARVGVDYAYGKSKVVGSAEASTEATETKNTNQEIVGRLEYAHTDNLAFSAFYSYVTQKPKGGDKSEQNNIRFEARYDF